MTPARTPQPPSAPDGGSSTGSTSGTDSAPGLALPEGTEARLAAIASTIEALAGLHLDARAPVSTRGDIIDAVAVGVNFLAEELEATVPEIERQVVERTRELQAATDELSRRVLHDELTGLASRALFFDRLAHRYRSAARRPVGFAVLFIDLDDFKLVNDTYGHDAGDRLLVQVASRIRAGVRLGDDASRMGGDEFLVLLDDPKPPETAMDVARRLGRSLDRAYSVDGTSLQVTASIGVALPSADLDTPERLVHAADIAMYAAKRHKSARTDQPRSSACALHTQLPQFEAPRMSGDSIW